MMSLQGQHFLLSYFAGSKCCSNLRFEPKTFHAAVRLVGCSTQPTGQKLLQSYFMSSSAETTSSPTVIIILTQMKSVCPYLVKGL